MQVSDQVISIDTAKRLKEIGVPQSSLFYWSTKENKIYYKDYCEEALRYQSKGSDQGLVSAFTLSEIGELLPEWSSSSKSHDGYWEAYPPALYSGLPTIHGELTEVEARVKLLITI